MAAEETSSEDMSAEETSEADVPCKGMTEYFQFDDNDLPAEEPDQTDVPIGAASDESGRVYGRISAVVFFVIFVVAVLGLGVWWGLKVAARQEIEELQAKLQSLQEKQEQHDRLSPLSQTCSLGQGRCGHPEVDTNDEAHDLDVIAAPSRESADARERSAGSLPTAEQASVLPKIDDVRGEDAPDLTCSSVPFKEWHDFKRLVAQHLGGPNSAVEPLSDDMLQSLLTVSTQGLQAMTDHVNACGMGRLCVTLLGVLAGEAEERCLLKAPSEVHSPLLTVLLDISWVEVVRSGWPLFGILAQMHLRRRKPDDLPGDAATAKYYEELQVLLVHGQFSTLAQTSAQYLNKREEEATDEDSEQSGVHVMPALCALACQLLGPQATSEGAIEEYLVHMQSFFKQAILSIEDLQQTLDSAWPLFPVLALAAARFNGLSAGSAAISAPPTQQPPQR